MIEALRCVLFVYFALSHIVVAAYLINHGIEMWRDEVEYQNYVDEKRSH